MSSSSVSRGRALRCITVTDVVTLVSDAMRVLVVAEHDGRALRAASLSCFTFAQAVAEATGGNVTWLVLGAQNEPVNAEASCLAPVISVDSPLLEKPLADCFARTIAAVVAERQFGLISAAATTFSKDVLP